MRRVRAEGAREVGGEKKNQQNINIFSETTLESNFFPIRVPSLIIILLPAPLSTHDAQSWEYGNR